jgi:hypothetical protein
LGALRRPEPREEDQEHLQVTVQPDERIIAPYPRWMVVSGLVLYCAVFWALIAGAGMWGVELIRTATAGAP